MSYFASKNLLNSCDYTSLSSGTTYYLRVTVEDEAGNSKVSDVVEQETVKIYTWYKYTYATYYVGTPTLITENYGVLIKVNVAVYINGNYMGTSTSVDYIMYECMSNIVSACDVNLFNFGGTTRTFNCGICNVIGYFVPLNNVNNAFTYFNHKASNYYLCVSSLSDGESYSGQVDHGSHDNQLNGTGNNANACTFVAGGDVWGTSSDSTYIKLVEFMEAVTGFEGDYPNDGEQDGYWYVLQDD